MKKQALFPAIENGRDADLGAQMMGSATMMDKVSPVARHTSIAGHDTLLGSRERPFMLLTISFAEAEEVRHFQLRAIRPAWL
jgi:hypothetical protein